MATTVKGRVLRAGSWRLAKKLIKPLPVVGTVLALGLAGLAIKKKGLLRGAIHVGLDATPVLGTAKNVLEIFTGDLIPDRVPQPESPRQKADTSRGLTLIPAGPTKTSITKS
jgi:hypothetical protein